MTLQTRFFTYYGNSRSDKSKSLITQRSPERGLRWRGGRGSRFIGYMSSGVQLRRHSSVTITALKIARRQHHPPHPHYRKMTDTFCIVFILLYKQQQHFKSSTSRSSIVARSPVLAPNISKLIQKVPHFSRGSDP